MQGQILQGAECLIDPLNFLGAKVMLVAAREHVVPSSMCGQSQASWLHNWLGTAEVAENTSCCNLYSQASESYSEADH